MLSCFLKLRQIFLGMALLSQLSHRHQDLSKCLHLNLHFPSRSSWHYQPCWQKTIWMLWLRFSFLSCSAHSGRVTTMRLTYFFSHCIAAKVKVAALLLKLPSLPAGTWTVLISLSNSRHYMLPVTVLCQMLSFNCFLYLAVASIFPFFSPFLCIYFWLYSFPSHIYH